MDPANVTNAPAEVLSPIKEAEVTQSATESNVKPQFTTLNDELTKINSRRDDVEPKKESEEEKKEQAEAVSTLAVPKATDAESGDKKERRISRFKVSVVTEPDQSKLTVPEKRKSGAELSVAFDNGKETEKDIVGVINDAFKDLEKAVSTSYAVKPGELFFLCWSSVVWRVILNYK